MAEGPFDLRAGLYEVGMGQRVNDRLLPNFSCLFKHFLNKGADGRKRQ